MFLNQVMKRNPKFIDVALNLFADNQLLPDSYLIDVDNFLANAKMILEDANSKGISLYFMLKQVGRNPYLAHKLMDLGYKGAVAVDFKEAIVMMNNKIPLCNVGHLVQCPNSLLDRVITYGCDYLTVYSLDKILKINEIAKKHQIKQKLMVRVIGEKDNIYPGQTAGFTLSELDNLVKETKLLSNVEIKGITNFPCFLYDEEKNDIVATENLETLFEAKRIFEALNVKIDNVNAPSTTSLKTLEKMAIYPIDSSEPGHGLSATTPYSAYNDTKEIPSVLYLSEVSHKLNGKSYCFGGGYYPRGHLENALVANKIYSVNKLPSDNIDYHLEINGDLKIGDPVLMAFRFQIFVTRSWVYLIEGVSNNKIKVVGCYSSNGDRYE